MTKRSSSQTRSKKRRRRSAVGNAARERDRIKTLRTAYNDLQRALPYIPPDTKLSKLEILMLASRYIRQLSTKLSGGVARCRSGRDTSYENFDKLIWQKPINEKQRKSHKSMKQQRKKWPIKAT
uniref:transcription factor 24-like n=1 Tax=Ciona intestinalis TaxID=7719 RepID=UPI000EF4AB05|nr:transcription factor 24-like [Ciona intestinalis]|eukprot:XP_026694004.1 transcription factor 24-like [Ciona intestinalis]